VSVTQKRTIRSFQKTFSFLGHPLVQKDLLQPTPEDRRSTNTQQLLKEWINFWI
jgi:hypothetical protein